MEGRLTALCVFILVLGAIGDTDAWKPVHGRPGQCPNFPFVKNRVCVLNVRPECKEDFDCPKPQKCCRDQCGSLCATPVKPGVCPWRPWIWKCYGWKNQCFNDFHCPGKEKCCRRGCQWLCSKPAFHRG